MNGSLFIELVEKYFSMIIGAITEKWNGRAQEETLLHKRYLTEEYSADLSWGSTELDHSVVAADVVALESSLPLKKRDAITTATGQLPKLGVKYRKGEKAISDINVMTARGAEEATVASKVFDDVTKCIKAMDVRKEIMFEQALSTGACLVEDADGKNDGTGVRASFGYKAGHTGYATVDWNTVATATPVTDLRNMFDKAEADGVTIGHVWIPRKYIDLLRKSAEGKELAANAKGLIVTSTSKLPLAGRQDTLEALRDEFGAEFHVVNSSFRVQKHDGTLATVNPWDEGAIVFTPTDQLGRLVYGTLAEETNPVAQVSYQKSGTHVLISKYSKTDPLEEFTAAQALCLPVIDGGDSIFLLHANSTSE